MSYKTAFSSYSKSFAEKKNLLSKHALSSNISSKDNNNLLIKTKSSINTYSIIHKNLNNYTTSIRKYHIFIINSIIFDQRIHKVAVFKNNLLWEESSEFLKRFYKKRESVERIPKISEYYEKYTLFPPVYFGLEGLIVVIMNKWTKRKKNYLEYIEDQEEEKEKKKNIKDISFEPLIDSSLINSKSNFSKITLDLSKFDIESNKKNKKNTSKIIALNTEDKIKDKNKEIKNSFSFSEIIDDLSSHYSIIFNDIKEKDKKEKNNISKKNSKKEGRNEINVKKPRHTLNYNAKTLNNNSKANNTARSTQIKNIGFPKKAIKICLNKKNHKFTLINNNANIINRNPNNMPFPIEIKKYQKGIMNTDNNIHKTNEMHISGTINIVNNSKSKGAIRVNTITNSITERNKLMNNNINQKNSKIIREESPSSKKINNIKNKNKKNVVCNNKKKAINNTIYNGSSYNFFEQKSIRKSNNQNNSIKKSYILIKRKSLAEIKNKNNNLNKQKTVTYRNDTNSKINSLHQKQSNSNISNENKNSVNKKNIKNIKPNKKIFIEDPFVYKLTQLTKKKQFCLTSVNSLTKIKGAKNFTHYDLNSIINNNSNNNSNNISNVNNKTIKNNCRKNLVLNKLNSNTNMIYDNKNKLLKDNKINKSSSLHKSNDSHSKLNFDRKISNSQSFKPNKANNSKNINLNFNLNINFNIDVENKNKRKKILLNKAIINQLQNKMSKNQKQANINQNKDNYHQYPLTSRNSKSHLKDFSDFNKLEYTILKKTKPKI